MSLTRLRMATSKSLSVMSLLIRAITTPWLTPTIDVAPPKRPSRGPAIWVYFVPAPASRRDHFRLRPDAWATLYTGQNQTIAAFLQAADEGIAATGGSGLARDRLVEMRDFYAFLLAEIPAVLERWHASRR